MWVSEVGEMWGQEEGQWDCRAENGEGTEKSEAGESAGELHSPESSGELCTASSVPREDVRVIHAGHRQHA